MWQRFGVTFGSDSNAQTTPTQTVYQLDLPSVTPANLDEGLKLLSGMIRAPRIPELAVADERGLVMAEPRESHGPQKRLAYHNKQSGVSGRRVSVRLELGGSHSTKKQQLKNIN